MSPHSRQRMGQAASFEAKRAVRRAVYEKLVRLGPSYRERVATSEAVQVSVDGVEQLEAYFGSYVPQLTFALLASLTLFATLAPLCLPAAVRIESSAGCGVCRGIAASGPGVMRHGRFAGEGTRARVDS